MTDREILDQLEQRMTRQHDATWWDTLRTRKEIRRELRNIKLDLIDRLREQANTE